MIGNSLNLIPHNSEAYSFFTLTNNFRNSDFNFNQKGIAFITDTSDFSTNLRKCIEKFKNHFKNIAIYDAGLTDTGNAENILILIHHLNQKQIIPFIVGIREDILGRIATSLDSNLYHISNSIHNITSETQFIRNNYIAYQRHLCALEDIYEIERIHYNSISLGKIRSYPILPEPILRDCQLLNVDLNAIRSSECPGLNNTLPTGLNIEELCQLIKYAGTANNLKSIFIQSSELKLDNHEAAKIIAECLWYFAEGLNFQHNYDHPMTNHNNSIFLVANPSLSEDLTFVKNNSTNRWWMKKTTGDSTEYLACSFEEYQSCINDGNIDRIEKFILEN